MESVKANNLNELKIVLRKNETLDKTLLFLTSIIYSVHNTSILEYLIPLVDFNLYDGLAIKVILRYPEIHLNHKIELIDLILKQKIEKEIIKDCKEFINKINDNNYFGNLIKKCFYKKIVSVKEQIKYDRHNENYIYPKIINSKEDIRISDVFKILIFYSKKFERNSSWKRRHANSFDSENND